MNGTQSYLNEMKAYFDDKGIKIKDEQLVSLNEVYSDMLRSGVNLSVHGFLGTCVVDVFKTDDLTRVGENTAPKADPGILPGRMIEIDSPKQAKKLGKLRGPKPGSILTAKAETPLTHDQALGIIKSFVLTQQHEGQNPVPGHELIKELYDWGDVFDCGQGYCFAFTKKSALIGLLQIDPPGAVGLAEPNLVHPVALISGKHDLMKCFKAIFKNPPEYVKDLIGK